MEITEDEKNLLQNAEFLTLTPACPRRKYKVVVVSSLLALYGYGIAIGYYCGRTKK